MDKQNITLNIQSLIGQVTYIVLPDALNSEELQRQIQTSGNLAAQQALEVLARYLSSFSAPDGITPRAGNSQ